ncbi:MAG: bifunctional UDP-sugar hydrolase/5'-nucleotidase [Candidatus Obscuribacterales bacterium]|nr:bifunctional UDP-sugar hydrolase/5'-nucleotidase [Candidatus Obscuribacterales bacterium]
MFVEFSQTNTRKKYKRLEIAAIVAALIISSVFCPAFAQQDAATKPDLQMTILHTNDLHAHDDVFSEHQKSVGGFARISTLIKKLRAESPNTVVVDAGDIFQGTPLYSLYHGEMEVHELNEMGYQIYTIGNHEFDDGPENLATQLSQAKFDIVSANMDCSGYEPLAKLVKPSVVKIIGGEKIGFVGAVTPDLESVSITTAPVKLKAYGSDWMEPIKVEVNRLKAEGINKIIIVSHSGLDHEKEMAQSVAGVDAIIGGHTHTRLEHPVIVEHADDGPTVIVQTGCYGRALGKLDLAFDKDGKIMLPETKYKLNDIDSSIAEDPQIQAYIDSKVAPVLKMRRDVLSHARASFEKDWLTTPWDSPLGDLITDALYEDAKKQGAQISFENRGGMRARIEKGPVSEETVQEMLPFDNFLTVATVDGDTLRKVLEHSVSKSLGGNFFDVHGLKIAYDKNLPVGQRITFVLAKDKDDHWQPIKNDEHYRIAVNSYSFSGGEGYDFSKATDKIESKQKMSDVLRDYLKTHNEITPESPSRIVPVSSKFDELMLQGSQKSDGDTTHPARRKKLEPLVCVGALPKGARLYAGDALGVEPVQLSDGHLVPVPVHAPKFILRCDNEESSFEIPISRLGSEAKFVCVVVTSQDKDGSNKTEISKPFPVSDLIKNGSSTANQGSSAHP